jgi:hypothetical protein
MQVTPNRTISRTRIMRNFVLTIIFGYSLFSNSTIAQKQAPFTGMLEYKISTRDTAMRELLPDSQMFLYTNDTIVRMENFTSQLGTQIAIRHMLKNKSYLLLETPVGKFAIQTHDKVNDTIKKSDQFEFKKKFFKRKICGMKANRMLVSHPDFEEPIEFLYLKKVPNRYLDVHNEIPGLLVRYSVITADGILDYELVRISRYTPNNDLFGVPSDYERISFDEFIQRMMKAKDEQPVPPQ